MSEILAKLTTRNNRGITALELTDTHLIDTWTKGRQSIEKKVLLSKLSPDLSCNRLRQDGIRGNFMTAIICLGFSVTLFFSVIQPKIPLLSVFFLFLSVWILIKCLLGLRIETWTIINRENGDRFSWFMHESCEDTERKAFEEAFVKVMMEVNQQSPSGDELKPAPEE